jgi:hypothetical protein
MITIKHEVIRTSKQLVSFKKSTSAYRSLLCRALAKDGLAIHPDNLKMAVYDIDSGTYRFIWNENNKKRISYRIKETNLYKLIDQVKNEAKALKTRLEA